MNWTSAKDPILRTTPGGPKGGQQNCLVQMLASTTRMIHQISQSISLVSFSATADKFSADLGMPDTPKETPQIG